MAIFGRLIAEAIASGISVLSRAVLAAYNQALQNAKSGGGAASAAASAMRRKMQTDEALKILNIEKPDLTSLLVETKYKKFYELNDPSKGGSFYLQSKIYRAKEALLEDMHAEAEGKSGSDKKASDSDLPGSSTTSTSNETKFGKK